MSVTPYAPDPPVGRLALPGGTRPRIALYSHDSTGLGHVRRNLLLAQRFAEEGVDVLLVSGSPEAGSMPRPPGVDIVTLPALSKGADGTYRARHLSLGLGDLRALRSAILRSTLSGFAPHLFVVDRHAGGFLDELLPTLEVLTGTRVVLGLRDVLDTPARVREEWAVADTATVLARWYDEVWVYGDGRIPDPFTSAHLICPVPVAAVGYLASERGTDQATTSPLGEQPFVLCTVGGGADGYALAEVALRSGPPEGYELLLVTGPQMSPTDRDRLRASADVARGRGHVVDFLPGLSHLIETAAAVVTMGGYNSLCEVLRSPTPALVVPRERPRREQRLRADALAKDGFVDTCHSIPSTRELRAWLADAVTRPRLLRQAINLDGLTHVVERSGSLLTDPPRPDRDRFPSVTARPAPSDPDQGLRHVAV